MLDLRQVCERFDVVQGALSRRGGAIDLSEIQALAARRRDLIVAYDTARHRQKQANDEMRAADKSSEAFQRLRNELREVGQRAREAESERKQVEEKLEQLLLYLPNLPHSSVPDGLDPAANEVVREWGSRREHDFAPRPHWEIGEALGILDFARGAKVAGARFTVYRDMGAKLERALIQFMLDIAAERGYEEILPPFLVKREAMVGTGQLPKFEDDAFALEQGALFLVPTAEVPLTNLHREEVIPGELLPLRYAAYTPCFRREAGSYGKDVRGLIRQHQFNKVELVKIVEPTRSYEELESMVDDAAEVLRRLELPHRVVALCAGDLGFASAKTYDLEVWCPGLGAYKEISSCSNCEDFQSRRINLRYRDARDGKLRYAHTLNGSALAVGRTVVAILENYQSADGTVEVPEALRPYLRAERIEARRPGTFL
jgi:seryl-tRNA synthetase